MSGRRPFCCYCKRTLEAPSARSNLAFTRDHIMPVARGGTRKVPCCRQCNQLKGSLHPASWRVFTDNFPRWWKNFSTNQEVRRALVELSWHVLDDFEDLTARENIA